MATELMFDQRFGSGRLRISSLSTKKWIARLREHAKEALARDPLPAWEDLPPAEREQSRILANDLYWWSRDMAPQVAQDRYVLAKVRPAAPNSVIVFTSNRPGLVAATKVIGPDNPYAVYLSREEFGAFQQLEPDPECVHHWLYESFFEIEPRDVARDDPRLAGRIRPGEGLWAHRANTIWGPLAARWFTHAWKWDGEKATLLEQAFGYGIS